MNQPRLWYEPPPVTSDKGVAPSPGVDYGFLGRCTYVSYQFERAVRDTLIRVGVERELAQTPAWLITPEQIDAIFERVDSDRVLNRRIRQLAPDEMPFSSEVLDRARESRNWLVHELPHELRKQAFFGDLVYRRTVERHVEDVVLGTAVCRGLIASLAQTSFDEALEVIGEYRTYMVEWVFSDSGPR